MGQRNDIAGVAKAARGGKALSSHGVAPASCRPAFRKNLLEPKTCQSYHSQNAWKSNPKQGVSATLGIGRRDLFRHVSFGRFASPIRCTRTPPDRTRQTQRRTTPGPKTGRFPGQRRWLLYLAPAPHCGHCRRRTQGIRGRSVPIVSLERNAKSCACCVSAFGEIRAGGNSSRLEIVYRCRDQSADLTFRPTLAERVLRSSDTRWKAANAGDSVHGGESVEGGDEGLAVCLCLSRGFWRASEFGYIKIAVREEFRNACRQDAGDATTRLDQRIGTCGGIFGSGHGGVP